MSLPAQPQKHSGTRVSLVFGVEVPISTLTIMFISARFYMRTYAKRPLRVDDWVMGGAALISIFAMGLNCAETKHAIGLHVWQVQPEVYLKAAKMGYASFILLTTCTSLTKLSMCLTYFRILTTGRDRIFCYCASLFILCSWLSITFTLIYACTHLPPDLKFRRASINDRAAIITSSAMNSATDFLVFLWPVRTLWAIRIPIKQRCGLVFVFAFGCVVCIAGVCRLWYLPRYYKSTDKTYDAAVLYVICAVEAHVGIICGCLPFLKPLLAHYFPGFFGSSYGRVRKSFTINMDDQSHTTVPLHPLPDQRGRGRVELARSLSAHSMQRKEAQWLANGGGVVAAVPKIASASVSIKPDPGNIEQVENGVESELVALETESREWVARPEVAHLKHTFSNI